MDKIDYKILEGLAEGKKQAEIAKELYLTQGAISGRIKRMRERGVEIPAVSKKDDYILKGLAEGKTQREIAKELGLAQTTISYRIKQMSERGVEVAILKKEKRGRTKRTQNDEIDNKILEGLSEGKNQTEIAKEVGLTHDTIYIRIKKMRERGVELPILRYRKTQNDEIDNKILEGLSQGKKQIKLAKELNLTRQRISQRIERMKERGVEIPKVFKIDNIDNKILEGLSKGKNQTEIAKELGLIQTTISHRIKKMRERGVEIPDAENIRNTLIDNKILKGLLEGKTQKEIAKELYLSAFTISNKIKQMRERGVEFPKTFKVDNIDNKILERLSKGKKQAEIAKELYLTQGAISGRIKRMRERGVEIPKVFKIDNIDNKILEGLLQGKKQIKLAKDLNLTRQSISKRVDKMRKRGLEVSAVLKDDEIDNKKLAAMIVNLKNTKHATTEQIKILGKYYGVDVDELLSSFDEQER